MDAEPPQTIAEVYTRQEIAFTEVTLRDGEQQDKRYPIMPVEERLRVLDSIVDAGMMRIEIGHLGNEHDIDFARAAVAHIQERGKVDDRYNRVDVQVLFGSQPDLIAPGLQALEGFSKDRVIVHVYDRVSPNLRHLATDPYTSEQSADRVAAVG